MLRWLRLTAIAVLSVAGVGARPGWADAPAGSPNIVVILADDLGWTDLGCYGSDFYQTPHIDRLAQQGMRFTCAYSACTVCSPSRAALMTGKSPARLHLTDWIPGAHRPDEKLRIPDWTKHLPLAETTLPEILKRQGYATAHLGKWHLGGSEFSPRRQGFDISVGSSPDGSPASYFSPYRQTTDDLRAIDLTPGATDEYLTDRLAAEAIQILATPRNQPLFLYLAHYAVHTPLQAKPALVEKYRAKANPQRQHHSAVYAAMIESLDDSVGRIMEELDRLGIAESTIVVFTSDNGGRLPMTANRPLRAGKGSVYEGGIRVPCIVRWPTTIKPGSVCDQAVITNDFFVTLLKAAGGRDADMPADIAGIDLSPLLRDPVARIDERSLFWHYPHYHGGGATPHSIVRSGDWKLIEFMEEDRVELYNLKTDIGEQTNLAEDKIELSTKLRKELRDWRTAMGAQLPTPKLYSGQKGHE